MPALAARLLFLAVLLPFSLPALALDDTPQNREAQAERYLAAVPPKSQIADTVAGIAETLPPEQQEQFKALMLKYFDIDKVSVAIRQAMVKTFTADELKALADFYGSQVAKSAVGKMDAYRGRGSAGNGAGASGGDCEGTGRTAPAGSGRRQTRRRAEEITPNAIDAARKPASCALSKRLPARSRKVSGQGDDETRA